MKRSKLKPTLADAFSVGKLEGLKEAFTELLEIYKVEKNSPYLKVYMEARLKTINNTQSEFNNPFKRDR